MSRRLLAAWATATVLVGITAAGCSDSASNGFRARNTASVPRCISVNRPLNQVALRATIADPACAVGVTNMSRSLFPMEDSTSSVLDGTMASRQEVTIRLSGDEYDLAFEARNADNEPVEYVRATGDPTDFGTLTLAYHNVTKVDSSGSCLKPLLTVDMVGFSGETCRGVTHYAFTFVTKNAQNSFNYATSLVNEWTLPTSMIAIANPAVVVTAFNGPDPTTRLAITRTSEEAFDAEFFSYSQPSTVRPNDLSDFEVSGEEQTAPEEETPLDTTPSSSTPSQEPSAGVSAASLIEDKCATIMNAFINPRPSEWTESKSFTIDVSNPCMKNSRSQFGEPIYQVRLLVTATDTESNETVTFYGSGDTAEAVRFTGRLPAGQWQVVLEQTATDRPSGTTRRATISQRIRVASDPANPWNRCDHSDIKWDGRELFLDCQYTTANAQYVTTQSTYLTFWLDPRFPREVIQFLAGWQTVLIVAETDGYRNSMLTLMCSTDCDQLPSGLRLRQSRDGDALRVFVDSSQGCAPALKPLYLFGLTRTNDRLFQVAQLGQLSFPIQIRAEELSVFTPPAGLTHLMALQMTPPSTNGCQQLATTSMAIAGVAGIPVPEAPAPVDLPDVPPVTVAPAPAPVADIELTNGDSTGTPVPVAPDQETVVVDPSSFPPSVFDQESDVESVEVAAPDGTWIDVGSRIAVQVPVAGLDDELSIRYTFADGTQAIVTKPLVTVADGDLPVDDGQSGSSFPLRIVFALVVVALAAGGTLIIRRRS